jgi:hypothetical protein
VAGDPLSSHDGSVTRVGPVSINRAGRLQLRLRKSQDHVAIALRRGQIMIDRGIPSLKDALLARITMRVLDRAGARFIREQA